MYKGFPTIPQAVWITPENVVDVELTRSRLIAPVVTLSAKSSFRRYMQVMRPEIQGRLTTKKEFKQSSRADAKQYEDVLDGHLNKALGTGKTINLDPAMIAYRIIFFSMSSFQTVPVAATHLMFDVYSADPSYNLIQELKTEIEEALASTGDSWNGEVIRNTPKLESTVRESMRLSCFSTRGCSRKVKHPDGYRTANGDVIPQGSTLTVSQWSIHQDEDVYRDAAAFKPYRFYSEKDRSSKAIGAVSEDFLPFGMGRHACPGRFFAGVMLKMILAYFITNYEVKPFAKRPQGRWIGTNHIPPLKAEFTIRKRS
ncbi:hypothetical protein KVT40_008393 [Elsinoe batatas]|uniref:Cytochrome P450 n=1 Tax=Elsinoe batatas TaxID=2601811 RepID=A0A8K0PCC9_9PEZI|nr:hypothetical protein KVT40_008393 [Elsinoe batatas]